MFRTILLLLIILLLEWYSFQALKIWVQPFSLSAKRIIWGVYGVGSVLAWSYILLGFTNLDDGYSKWLRIYGRAGVFVWFVAKLPIAGVLLIDDLRRFLSWGINYFAGEARFNPSRSRFMAKAALIMGGIPFSMLTYGMVRNGFRYRLIEEEVPIQGLPQELAGLKVVQISDMHSGSWTDNAPLQRAVDLINEQEADIVCFTGDIVNNLAREMHPFIPTFKQIRAKYGVYSIMGNHDYGDYHRYNTPGGYERNREEFYQVHRDLGWDLLLNENRLLDINGQQLALIGVENWSAIPRFPRKGDLAKAYEGSQQAAARILLSHDPTHWEAQVQDYPDIDLMLAGHTHGFQFGIEIPGFRWSPAQFMYKQWAGLYKKGRQHLYVNRGLGFLGYPGRVGILPEVTLLRLVPA